ncbi:hypothetical protein JKQ03_09370 [Staphylococcus sp. S36]|nr:hypothetical protein [Staphylococcus sp. S36]
MSKMFFTMMSAFAEIEANLLSELKAGRARDEKAEVLHCRIIKKRVILIRWTKTLRGKKLLKELE